MRITINTNESNKILTAPIKRILDSIAYTMYDLSKVNFVSMTKDKVAQYFRDCQMDNFIIVIECITLNQSGVAYTINMDKEDIEELEKVSFDFKNIFKSTYTEAYSNICEVISGYTKNGFLFSDTNFTIALNYFNHESAIMMQSLQLIDVYKYYKELDCSEDEFIAMLPEDIKLLAKESITYMKNEYNDFDISNPNDMEQLIDDMYASNEDIISILRDSVVRHKEL